MQKTIYQCDQCKAELGDKTHIHMDTRSNARIGIALKNEKVPVGEVAWGLHAKLGQEVYHFCNGTCIGRFFTALKKKVEAKPEAKRK